MSASAAAMAARISPRGHHVAARPGSAATTRRARPDSLERQWNEALAHLAEVEAAYTRTANAPPGALSAEARTRIQALAADLPRVWHDPRTPARDRKRLLRLLLEDVTLVRADAIQLHLRWKGGATTSCTQRGRSARPISAGPRRPSSSRSARSRPRSPTRRSRPH